MVRNPSNLKRPTVTRVYPFQCLLLLLQTHYFFFQLTSHIIILFSILLAMAVSCSLLPYIARVVGSIYFLPSLFPSIPSYFLEHYSALFFDLEGLWKLYFLSFSSNIYGRVTDYECRPHLDSERQFNHQHGFRQILFKWSNQWGLEGRDNITFEGFENYVHYLNMNKGW